MLALRVGDLAAALGDVERIGDARGAGRDARHHDLEAVVGEGPCDVVEQPRAISGRDVDAMRAGARVDWAGGVIQKPRCQAGVGTAAQLEEAIDPRGEFHFLFSLMY